MGAYEFQGTSSRTGITQQPSSGSSVCVGSAVVVPVSVSGVGNSYQWYKDGNLLTGIGSATTATLSLTNVQLSDVGSYLVVGTGSCNSVTSTAFSLTVNSQSTFLLSASPSTTLTCTQTSLTLIAPDVAGTTYHWRNGSTGATLLVNTTGTYSVTATDPNGCSAESNTVSIDQDLSMPAFTVGSVSVCATQQAVLQASGCSGGVIQWPDGTTGHTFVTIAHNASVITATCTIGICSTTASGNIVIRAVASPPGVILSLTANESTCPVRLIG